MLCQPTTLPLPVALTPLPSYWLSILQCLQQQQYLAPTTYSPSPTGPGRKKALLIGCTYPGTSSHLRGPANDVNCMQYLLRTKLGFPAANIVVLRDDSSKGRDFMPFRDVIFRALGWLVADLRQVSGEG